MIKRINPPLPLDTPKGPAYAHFLIDRGQESHIHWICFLDETGECWTFENPDIRLQSNLTMARTKKEHEWCSFWNEERK